MQPVPLTGTATQSLENHKHPAAAGCSPCPSRGQQRTRPSRWPGSDRCSPCPSRGQQPLSSSHLSTRRLRCSPHPSRGQQQMRRRCHSPQMRDAARAPHGDNNFSLNPVGKRLFGDAARAPHGDSNQIPAYPTQSNIVMQPVPLTGTKKRETRNSSVSCLPFYISACSLTSLFHIDEEGYAGILCHSPCAAGFRCVLRGRRQLVYILSLYLSYVKFILRHNLSYDKYIQLKTCIKPPP